MSVREECAATADSHLPPYLPPHLLAHLPTQSPTCTPTHPPAHTCLPSFLLLSARFKLIFKQGVRPPALTHPAPPPPVPLPATNFQIQILARDQAYGHLRSLILHHYGRMERQVTPAFLFYLHPDTELDSAQQVRGA